MILRYLLLADAAVAMEGGKVNLIGAGVEAIFVPAVPAIHSVLTVAIRVDLTRDEAAVKHSLEIALTGPDGNRVAGGLAEVGPVPPEVLAQIPEGGTIGAPLLLPLANIVLPTFGPYELAVTWDGDPLADPLPLTVVERPEA